MSSPPEKVRRPVAAAEPATDPSIRRIYWLGGAAVGVVAGALLALFAIPPLFDRYFNTADIALGDAYERDGVRLRVAEVAAIPENTPARFEVRVEILEPGDWCPKPSDFRLELDGNVSLAPTAFAPPLTCGEQGLAATSLLIAFSAAGHGADDPRILHVDELRVRFHLYPGEPE
jgi:hypothetical protein